MLLISDCNTIVPCAILYNVLQAHNLQGQYSIKKDKFQKDVLNSKFSDRMKKDNAADYIKRINK